MTKPRSLRTRIKKKRRAKAGDGDKKDFARLASYFVHSSDADEQARLKRKLARRTFED